MPSFNILRKLCILMCVLSSFSTDFAEIHNKRKNKCCNLFFNSNENIKQQNYSSNRLTLTKTNVNTVIFNITERQNRNATSETPLKEFDRNFFIITHQYGKRSKIKQCDFKSRDYLKVYLGKQIIPLGLGINCPAYQDVKPNKDDLICSSYSSNKLFPNPNKSISRALCCSQSDSNTRTFNSKIKFCCFDCEKQKNDENNVFHTESKNLTLFKCQFSHKALRNSKGRTQNGVNRNRMNFNDNVLLRHKRRNINCSPHCKSKCDAKTGVCRPCLSGYQGRFCNQTCTQGFYGKSCAQRCPQSCDEIKCHHETGHCFKCKPGYISELCDVQCIIGYYGTRCSGRCSEMCVDQICDFRTGECHDCLPGYFGPKCNTLCPATTYGPKCMHTCSRGCKSECDRASGECLECLVGFKGPQCNESCLKGFHGVGCHETCPDGCYNDECRVEDGSCFNCKPMLQGKFCRQNFSTQSFNNTRRIFIYSHTTERVNILHIVLITASVILTILIVIFSVTKYIIKTGTGLPIPPFFAIRQFPCTKNSVSPPRIYSSNTRYSDSSDDDKSSCHKPKYSGGTYHADKPYIFLTTEPNTSYVTNEIPRLCPQPQTGRKHKSHHDLSAASVGECSNKPTPPPPVLIHPGKSNTLNCRNHLQDLSGVSLSRISATCRTISYSDYSAFTDKFPSSTASAPAKANDIIKLKKSPRLNHAKSLNLTDTRSHNEGYFDKRKSCSYPRVVLTGILRSSPSSKETLKNYDSTSSSLAKANRYTKGQYSVEFRSCCSLCSLHAHHNSKCNIESRDSDNAMITCLNPHARNPELSQGFPLENQRSNCDVQGCHAETLSDDFKFGFPQRNESNSVSNELNSHFYNEYECGPSNKANSNSTDEQMYQSISVTNVLKEKWSRKDPMSNDTTCHYQEMELNMNNGKTSMESDICKDLINGTATIHYENEEKRTDYNEEGNIRYGNTKNVKRNHIMNQQNFQLNAASNSHGLNHDIEKKSKINRMKETELIKNIDDVSCSSKLCECSGVFESNPTSDNEINVKRVLRHVNESPVKSFVRRPFPKRFSPSFQQKITNYENAISKLNQGSSFDFSFIPKQSVSGSPSKKYPNAYSLDPDRCSKENWDRQLDYQPLHEYDNFGKRMYHTQLSPTRNKNREIEGFEPTVRSFLKHNQCLHLDLTEVKPIADWYQGLESKRATSDEAINVPKSINTYSNDNTTPSKICNDIHYFKSPPISKRWSPNSKEDICKFSFDRRKDDRCSYLITSNPIIGTKSDSNSKSPSPQHIGLEQKPPPSPRPRCLPKSSESDISPRSRSPRSPRNYKRCRIALRSISSQFLKSSETSPECPINDKGSGRYSDLSKSIYKYWEQMSSNGINYKNDIPPQFSVILNQHEPQIHDQIKHLRCNKGQELRSELKEFPRKLRNNPRNFIGSVDMKTLDKSSPCYGPNKTCYCQDNPRNVCSIHQIDVNESIKKEEQLEGDSFSYTSLGYSNDEKTTTQAASIQPNFEISYPNVSTLRESVEINSQMILTGVQYGRENDTRNEHTTASCDSSAHKDKIYNVNMTYSPTYQTWTKSTNEDSVSPPMTLFSPRPFKQHSPNSSIISPVKFLLSTSSQTLIRDKTPRLIDTLILGTPKDTPAYSNPNIPMTEAITLKSDANPSIHVPNEIKTIQSDGILSGVTAKDAPKRLDESLIITQQSQDILPLDLSRKTKECYQGSMAFKPDSLNIDQAHQKMIIPDDVADAHKESKLLKPSEMRLSQEQQRISEHLKNNHSQLENHLQILNKKLPPSTLNSKISLESKVYSTPSKSSVSRLVETPIETENIETDKEGLKSQHKNNDLSAMSKTNYSSQPTPPEDVCLSPHLNSSQLENYTTKVVVKGTAFLKNRQSSHSLSLSTKSVVEQDVANDITNDKTNFNTEIQVAPIPLSESSQLREKHATDTRLSTDNTRNVQKTMPFLEELESVLEKRAAAVNIPEEASHEQDLNPSSIHSISKTQINDKNTQTTITTSFSPPSLCTLPDKQKYTQTDPTFSTIEKHVHSNSSSLLKKKSNHKRPQQDEISPAFKDHDDLKSLSPPKLEKKPISPCLKKDKTPTKCGERVHFDPDLISPKKKKSHKKSDKLSPTLSYLNCFDQSLSVLQHTLRSPKNKKTYLISGDNIDFDVYLSSLVAKYKNSSPSKRRASPTISDENISLYSVMSVSEKEKVVDNKTSPVYGERIKFNPPLSSSRPNGTSEHLKKQSSPANGESLIVVVALKDKEESEEKSPKKTSPIYPTKPRKKKRCPKQPKPKSSPTFGELVSCISPLLDTLESPTILRISTNSPTSKPTILTNKSPVTIADGTLSSSTNGKEDDSSPFSKKKSVTTKMSTIETKSPLLCMEQNSPSAKSSSARSSPASKSKRWEIDKLTCKSSTTYSISEVSSCSSLLSMMIPNKYNAFTSPGSGEIEWHSPRMNSVKSRDITPTRKVNDKSTQITVAENTSPRSKKKRLINQILSPTMKQDAASSPRSTLATELKRIYTNKITGSNMISGSSPLRTIIPNIHNTATFPTEFSKFSPNSKSGMSVNKLTTNTIGAKMSTTDHEINYSSPLLTKKRVTKNKRRIKTPSPDKEENILNSVNTTVGQQFINSNSPKRFGQRNKKSRTTTKNCAGTLETVEGDNFMAHEKNGIMIDELTMVISPRMTEQIGGDTPIMLVNLQTKIDVSDSPQNTALTTIDKAGEPEELNITSTFDRRQKSKFSNDVISDMGLLKMSTDFQNRNDTNKQTSVLSGDMGQYKDVCHESDAIIKKNKIYDFKANFSNKQKSLAKRHDLMINYSTAIKEQTISNNVAQALNPDNAVKKMKTHLSHAFKSLPFLQAPDKKSCDKSRERMEISIQPYDRERETTISKMSNIVKPFEIKDSDLPNNVESSFLSTDMKDSKLHHNIESSNRLYDKYGYLNLEYYKTPKSESSLPSPKVLPNVMMCSKIRNSSSDIKNSIRCNGTETSSISQDTENLSSFQVEEITNSIPVASAGNSLTSMRPHYKQLSKDKKASISTAVTLSGKSINSRPKTERLIGPSIKDNLNASYFQEHPNQETMSLENAPLSQTIKPRLRRLLKRLLPSESSSEGMTSSLFSAAKSNYLHHFQTKANVPAPKQVKKEKPIIKPLYPTENDIISHRIPTLRTASPKSPKYRCRVIQPPSPKRTISPERGILKRNSQVNKMLSSPVRTWSSSKQSSAGSGSETSQNRKSFKRTSPIRANKSNAHKINEPATATAAVKEITVMKNRRKSKCPKSGTKLFHNFPQGKQSIDIADTDQEKAPINNDSFTSACNTSQAAKSVTFTEDEACRTENTESFSVNCTQEAISSPKRQNDNMPSAERNSDWKSNWSQMPHRSLDKCSLDQDVCQIYWSPDSDESPRQNSPPSTNRGNVIADKASNNKISERVCQVQWHGEDDLNETSTLFSQTEQLENSSSFTTHCNSQSSVEFSSLRTAKTARMVPKEGIYPIRNGFSGTTTSVSSSDTYITSREMLSKSISLSPRSWSDEEAILNQRSHILFPFTKDNKTRFGSPLTSKKTLSYGLRRNLTGANLPPKPMIRPRALSRKDTDKRKYIPKMPNVYHGKRFEDQLMSEYQLPRQQATSKLRKRAMNVDGNETPSPRPVDDTPPRTSSPTEQHIICSSKPPRIFSKKKSLPQSNNKSPKSSSPKPVAKRSPRRNAACAATINKLTPKSCSPKRPRALGRL